VQKEVLYVTENRWPDLNNEYTVVKHEKMVALHLQDLECGDHFGEEMILGHDTRQYSVVANEKCEVFAINKGDVMNFFKGNQIQSEIKQETAMLYEGAEKIKARHEEKKRQQMLYKEIKGMAFGGKYKERAGLNVKKKIRRKQRGGLEATLRKLNQQSWERSAKGLDAEAHDQHDEIQLGGDEASVGSRASQVSKGGRSAASGRSSQLGLPPNPLVLPVLRSSVSVRRESQSERQNTMRASVSMPTLNRSVSSFADDEVGGRPPRHKGDDGIMRLRQKYGSRQEDEERRHLAKEKEDAMRRRGGKLAPIPRRKG
jgi:hypothetical protein